MKRLPNPNEPLRVGDGVSIPPSASQTFSRVEIPSNTQAQRLVSNTRRKLVDLPALPKQMNAYAAILVYSASGLSHAEIAVATGFSAEQVKALQEHPAYQQLERYIFDAVREQSKEDVVAILADKERRAAERVGELVDSADEKVALAASNSILDRRGHNAKQQIDIRAEMMNTFRIEYVDRRGEPQTIDMEVDNGDGT